MKFTKKNHEKIIIDFFLLQVENSGDFQILMQIGLKMSFFLSALIYF